MTDPKDYEEHVRSNESVRDSMDGKLDEPRMAQSTETCENTHNCSRCDGSQSME